jgi:hypothetical protein
MNASFATTGSVDLKRIRFTVHPDAAAKTKSRRAGLVWVADMFN